MNCYETLFVVKPTLTEQEIASQVTKIKDVLVKEGAELIATDDMGMRKLAYTVDKQNRGYYTVLYYKADGSKIAEIERNLKINEDIIKFLTVKYGSKKEVAQFEKMIASIGKTKNERTPREAAPKKEVVVEEVTTEATQEVTE
ncbi:30S ribosomal subunit (SSU) protein S6 [Sulfurovum sp. enrichment culture clone C5]|uniref:Small ribosomal subunit protein bS6 n=1 Tax=Sulfurovum sp. enrichment culture clone C5 TaxID=497650 RepID=A0A0S4XMC8_9BACT|nr:30S ribosomal subunit (SSU) protein S6 [Sulfurovum sp. enrichment culture clone C5]